MGREKKGAHGAAALGESGIKWWGRVVSAHEKCSAFLCSSRPPDALLGADPALGTASIAFPSLFIKFFFGVCPPTKHSLLSLPIFADI